MRHIRSRHYAGVNNVLQRLITNTRCHHLFQYCVVHLPHRRASNDWQAPNTLIAFVSMRSRIIGVAWK
ncbi:hypothetical protein TNCV_747981 [Trichonephila clavipes]|nr:hypothetical protein TNCV_747981 [Trichonephila clavipes]